MKASHFSADVQEFLRLLAKHHVKYVIIGGEAVIFHGYSRLTGDVDFFYDPSGQNVGALYRVLMEFWGGDIPGLEGEEELVEEGLVLQFGVPPNRIDLLNTIDAVQPQSAWASRETVTINVAGERVPVHFIGLEELMRNKEAIKRHKDQEDLEFLREVTKMKKR